MDIARLKLPLLDATAVLVKMMAYKAWLDLQDGREAVKFLKEEYTEIKGCSTGSDAPTHLSIVKKRRCPSNKHQLVQNDTLLVTLYASLLPIANSHSLHKIVYLGVSTAHGVSCLTSKYTVRVCGGLLMQ